MQAELDRQRMDWEGRLNQAEENYASEMTSVKCNYEAQITQHREAHEAAMANLEREKNEILEGNTRQHKKLSFR